MKIGAHVANRSAAARGKIPDDSVTLIGIDFGRRHLRREAAVRIGPMGTKKTPVKFTGVFEIRNLAARIT
jgi:hypothetical protein